MRENGWYKVKLKGKWVCAYNDGSESWPWIIGAIFYTDSELDQIGEKIEFPND